MACSHTVLVEVFNCFIVNVNRCAAIIERFFPGSLAPIHMVINVISVHLCNLSFIPLIKIKSQRITGQNESVRTSDGNSYYGLRCVRSSDSVSHCSTSSGWRPRHLVGIVCRLSASRTNILGRTLHMPRFDFTPNQDKWLVCEVFDFHLILNTEGWNEIHDWKSDDAPATSFV